MRKNSDHVYRVAEVAPAVVGLLGLLCLAVFFIDVFADSWAAWLALAGAFVSMSFNVWVGWS